MSKTFTDQIPPVTGRVYSLVALPDGKTQIIDVTEYVQAGTPWGAADANQAMRKEDYESDGAITIEAGGTGGKTATAARTNLGAAAATDMATAQTNITALQKAATTLFTTAGSAPAFTVADASVTAYASGLRRTVQFHAAGTNATLNFNGLGAKALYEYTGKQMSVKAGQVVEVCYNGTYFFGVSVGGGVEFPSTPAAGDTPIWFSSSAISLSITSTWKDIPTRTLTIKKAGTYRFKYAIGQYQSAGPNYARLVKNGVEVANSIQQGSSEMQLKTIDVACAANDVIKEQGMTDNNNGQALTAFPYLIVSVLAADVQTAINDMVV